MRHLQLDELALYARVAELGSLSAVARERDVPVSQVSRTLARLEKACGARLMRRSTHGLSLTEEGRTFLDYSQRAVVTMEELEGEFAARSAEPSGRVRVATSTVVAQYQIIPSLPELSARHPRLQIDLEVGDRLADMTREGIDIAIRAGGELADTAVARQIGTLGRAPYAAPAYVQAHGLPAQPEELARHRLITTTAVPLLNAWPFRCNGTTTLYSASGHWRANDSGMTATLVLQGLGIGRMSTLVGEPLVRAGQLVHVLQEHVDVQTVPVFAVTAGTRHRLPKIKACVDYWAEWFAKGNA